MLLILLLLVLVHVLSLGDLLNDKAEFIIWAQNNCTSVISDKAAFKPLVDAFLCGVNIHENFLREPFIKTGLIHLLVVSGGHFAFLVAVMDFFSSRLPVKNFWLEILKLPVFIAFSLLTGFQPPVVRALASLLLQYPNRFFRWHWDHGKVLLVSGLLVLSLFPEWLISQSFYLSWLASLGLCFSPLWKDQSLQGRFSKKTILLQWISVCFAVQTLLSLFFWNFSFLSLLMNLLFAPLLMFVLWPLCLCLVIIPPLAPYTDLCWKFLLDLLKFFSQFSSSRPLVFDSSQFHWLYLWSLVVALHCLLEILTKERFKKSYA